MNSAGAGILGSDTLGINGTVGNTNRGLCGGAPCVPALPLADDGMSGTDLVGGGGMSFGGAFFCASFGAEGAGPQA